MQDNRAEVARMEAELRRYEAQEAEAKKHQSDQQQREAEQKRKAAEGRLKAEQLRQQQLAEEAKRQQEMAEERTRFDAEQKLREQEMSAAQKAEEQRLAALKAELARKRQTVPTSATGSLAATVSEIKRLNSEIESVKAAFSRELSASQTRITTRNDAEIASVRQASKQKQAPLVKDEFETEAEYRAKVARQQVSFGERISELERKRQSEITDLENRLAREQQSQTADLRQSLKQLADKEFSVGAETLSLELGAYNPDKQSFPVTIRNKVEGVQVAMNGAIPLPRDAARKFKQEYASGLVRAEATVKVGSSDVTRVAVANDSNNSIYEYYRGDFVTVAERRRREVAAVELDRLTYTDPKTGLMWARNGNIAGKQMNWNDAMSWAKNLNYAGYSDWQLPTKYELEAFAKRDGNRPSEYFNANDFSNVQASSYWSSTTSASNPVFAWYVDMDGGFVYSYNKFISNYVWPVRGGQ